MSGNRVVLENSGCGGKNGIMPCWRLFGFAALLAVNLISPPVLASSLSSFTALSESSRGGFAIETPIFSADWSRMMGSDFTSWTLRRSFSVEAYDFSTDWSRIMGSDFTSRASVESLGESAEFGINTLVWLAAMLTSMPMLLVILQAFMAMGFRKRKVTATLGKAFPRTVVLIPAHNEEDVISRCIASLSVDLPRWPGAWGRRRSRYKTLAPAASPMH
jgi:hypothetical protein